MRGSRRDRRIADLVTGWFSACARDLPWRRERPGGGRDPYRSLVSEAMLQQTQVTRVVERFGAFVERFPTFEALAAASEEEVLAAWSGLGYYRRARHLHAASRVVVAEHGGRAPRDAASLRRLPGVGPYTAGAIASIVFGQREPIVDGNVRRVLVRLEGRDVDEPVAAEDAWAWRRAGELVGAASAPGAFNEGLMELGAVVCTPASPGCGACPVARSCVARREGLVDRLPRPRKGGPRREVWHASVVVRDSRGRVLVERRGDGGLWAGLWQAPTLEGEREPAAASVRARVGLAWVEERERFDHVTTHRLVRFVVYEGGLGPGRRPAVGEWRARGEVGALGLSSAQRRVLLPDEDRV